MLRTMHGRLAGVLLGLLLLVGGFGLGVWTVATDWHVSEVQQQLHRDLAQQIASAKEDLFLDPAGTLRADALDELFHWLMVVNPGIEFYLLDEAGRIQAHDPSLGDFIGHGVDLGPVEAFLSDKKPMPLLGFDPRTDQEKIFSVAPIPSTGPARGYLYIILASEQYESLTDRLRRSHALRLGVGVLFVCLLVAGGVGWWVFRWMTHPLRRLTDRMRTWQQTVIGGGERPASEAGDVNGQDEVNTLEQVFLGLAGRVEEQMGDMERGEALRRELVANVSHDLRTPIASLQGYLDTLVLKDDSLSPQERDEYLQIALRQSERLGKLVDELFELTKLENEAIELNLEPFSINELVQDNVQRYQLRSADSGVDLRAEFDPALPFVEADLGMIERVLENLIDNALRFTPRGGSVVLGLSGDQEGVRVSVRDTGRGIPADALPHVFERFYRVAENGRRDGSGLGLAIARRILELHGSVITVDSEPHKGSVFAFHLPSWSPSSAR